MKTYTNPTPDTWAELCQRPQLELEFLESSVRNVLNRVRKSGDEALLELTAQYDKVQLASLEVGAAEIEAAGRALPEALKDAIRTAAANIEKFHAAQRRDVLKVETTPGVHCWRKGVAIDKVGIYIPGGSAPLFSTVLMLGIPARLAGCREIVLCSPPDKTGAINPAILFAAAHVGIKRICKVGGAQAIAAMAYGTPSVPKVYKIFGPGNQYVTKAKQLVQEEGLAIDMPAGPSEVLVMADETAEPAFVAADLLSQAEHGEDSQVMLVLNDARLLAPVEAEIERQLTQLPRRDIARKALANSRAVVLADRQQALDFVNTYAPEHLILNIARADAVAGAVINAGSVFIGNYTPEAMGDYASGTNHTLPTNGFARAFAGVSLESFMKYITFQEVSAAGIRALGPVVERMAEAEQLEAHKMAIRVRLDKLASNP
ncbi:histidinol dehydrogenase [Dawidia soli]|uniref:Histidinol dehydrogenase n=1 Tax=Dawidia soli TaxID=2782352 RepID=A0AAP2D4P4_9BACT|nr:histidinol dehydrogenase [Dawidia soli]MBT1685097.1 histidinol dehydrogenase [Dawidia soli]